MKAPEFNIFTANAFMIQVGDYISVKSTIYGDNCNIYPQSMYKVIKDGELSSSGNKLITVVKGFETETINTEDVRTYTPSIVLEYGEEKAREGYSQAVAMSLLV